jgi:hypothetical protein
VLTHKIKIESSPPGTDRRLLVISKLIAGLALTSAMTVDADWTIAFKPDSVTHRLSCILSSESHTTSDGYDSTPVSLEFNGRSLLVVTESELDLSFNDLQLTVDNKPSVHSDNIIHKKTLVFDQSITELMPLLRSGQVVTVHLRFWPTWPETKSFPVRFSLSDFRKAFDGLNPNCQSSIAVQEQIQQRSKSARLERSPSSVQSQEVDRQKPVTSTTGIVPALSLTKPSLIPVMSSSEKASPSSALEPVEIGKHLMPMADGSAKDATKQASKVTSNKSAPKKSKKPLAQVTKRKNKHTFTYNQTPSDNWDIKKND